MNDAARKLIASSVICYVVGFLTLLLVSVLSFSLERTLSVFFWDWVFARTWSDFIRLLPVAQAWAVLLTYAWAIPMARTDTGAVSFTLFTGSIVVVLVTGLLFAVVFLVWHPRAVSRVEEVEYTSALAQTLYESANEAEINQDYQTAEIELSQYLSLVGEDPDVQAQLQRVLNRLEFRREAGAEVDGSRGGIPQDATVDSLLDRAQAALQREDYSTAHYMATLARSLAPTSDSAARIAAESLDRLEQLELNFEEGRELDLFRQKQRAKGLLTRDEPIQAYYLLAGLEEEYPRDTDVRRYLQIAQEQVEAQAVFRDEVEQALSLPGVLDIVFVNRRTADRTELVSIGKLVETPSGIFAQQVEAIEFTNSGRPTYRVRSNYARFIDGHFVFTILDRGAGGQIIDPVISVGSATRQNPGLLELSPAAAELSTIADLSRNPESASLTGLLQGSELLDRYGILTTPLQVELFQRLLSPVTFVVLSLFCVGLGWRFRSKYLHMPPLLTLAVVPVLPLVLVPLHQLILYGERVVLSAVLLSAGFSLAIVLLILVQAGILLFVLFYLALAARR